MSERMTAEQAWAEVDRLDAIKREKWSAHKAAEQASEDAWQEHYAAHNAACTIGPRPVKPLPESACRHRACDGSGRTATKDGNFQLCICLVPS